LFWQHWLVVRDEGASKLAASLDTPKQKIKDLQNAFEAFQVAVTTVLLPKITDALEGLSGTLTGLTTLTTNLGDAWGYVAYQIGPFLSLLDQVTNQSSIQVVAAAHR